MTPLTACNHRFALLIPALLLGAVALVGQESSSQSSSSNAEPAKAKNVFDGRTSPTVRDALLKAGGGNERSEAAVAAGLKWLARHQALDGHWGMHDFHIHGKCNCMGPGGNHDVAATSFGLLPFLGAGETHKNAGKNNLYAKNVERCLKWLIVKQTADGAFSGNGYEHALATVAVCEAYGMTLDPALKGPAQRAINCCVAWQHQAGGFRYSPRTPGDLSVGGWFAQALTTGRLAGLNIPNNTFTCFDQFLDACATPDGSGYGYVSPQPAPTVTAIGLLARQFQGWDAKHPALVKGLDTLNKIPPSENYKNIYYYFYAAQVVHRLSPEHKDATQRWKERMRDLLIEKQDQGTNADRRDQKGSWSPEGDAWGGQLGRLAHTSLSLLTLEIYYRHAPGDAKVAADVMPEGKPEPKAEAKPEPKAGAAPDLAAAMQELKNRDSDMRLAAAQKLAKFGPAAKEAVPNLTTALKDSNAEVRAAAQQALEAIHAEEVAALVKQLGDKDQKSRPQVARKLGDLGAIARSAIPALEQALKDEDPLVQFTARSALGKINAAVKSMK